jgi:hypothetical protein
VGMGQTTMTNASNSQTFRFSFFGVCNAENEIYTWCGEFIEIQKRINPCQTLDFRSGNQSERKKDK